MKFETSNEFAPLSGIDEYLIHNHPTPQRVMYTSDLRAFERTWFTAQDRAGDLFIACGKGFYPNLDTADAFAIVVYKGKLSYVRHHRRLGVDRMNMRFGPLNWEILAPFKTWKLTLGNNPHGIRYEMYWHDTKRAVFSDVYSTVSPHARTPGFAAGQVSGTPGEHVGYETFGEVEGWVEVEGKRIELSTESHFGSRDHHWGVRQHIGGIGEPIARPRHFGLWIEFKDWSIWGSKSLYPLDDKRPGAGRLVPIDRRLKFDEETGEFREGLVTCVDEAGNTKELHLRRQGFQTAYLRCGGYGPISPDDGGTHGVYVGDDRLFGGAFDLTEASVRKQLSNGSVSQHACEVTCGDEKTYGILECFEPLLITNCENGEPGFSFL